MQASVLRSPGDRAQSPTTGLRRTHNACLVRSSLQRGRRGQVHQEGSAGGLVEEEEGGARELERHRREQHLRVLPLHAQPRGCCLHQHEEDASVRMLWEHRVQARVLALERVLARGTGSSTACGLAAPPPAPPALDDPALRTATSDRHGRAPSGRARHLRAAARRGRGRPPRRPALARRCQAAPRRRCSSAAAASSARGSSA